MGRQQGIVAHQAADAILGHPNVVQDAQPRPYLAMAFADERRSPKVSTNGRQEIGIGNLRLWLATGRMQRDYLGVLPGLLGVDRRARELQHPCPPGKPTA